MSARPESAASAPALSVCVFCGAREGRSPEFRELATRVGISLARRGWTLVYGGGDIGLMGALASGALSVGGRVIGVIPQALLAQEHGKNNVTRLEIVPSMGVRKERMIAVADAFLILPGGLGTLDELFEVLTLRQIGLHHKPIGILDHGGYFSGLLTVLAGMAEAGFVNHGSLDHLLVGDSLATLLDRLAAARSQGRA